MSFFLVIGTTSSFAQKVTVIGKIIDDQSLETMPGATTMLLQKSDSTLYKFGITNNKGELNIKFVEPGEYLFLASFIGYTSLYKNVTISNDHTTFDIGELKMQVKREALKAVEIVEEVIPIQINGDTIDYNANAFKTQPESNVGDLLKKLPGVEVDDNGTVKAQGEDVQKVLIDGKEFFGNDTKMATENLPADMVKKVQVYDDLSDLSKMTGIDDGNTIKTINLKLKKDRKKGVFGDVTLGGGSTANLTGDLNNEQGLYDNKFNINKFKDDMQLSALGMINNVNKQGFTRRDYINFTGGGANSFRGRNNNNEGVPLGSNANDGFTETMAGGINLNYDLNKNANISTNYFYNQTDKDLESIIDRQYIADSNNFNSLFNDLESQFSRNHILNVKYKQKLDSTQDLTISGNLTVSSGNESNISENTNTDLNDVFLNASSSNNFSQGSNFSGTATLLYGKRFKKKGRSFVTNATLGNSNNEKEYNIESINRFSTGIQDPIIISNILQNQDEESSQLNYEVKVNYTEPIAKRTYLETNYERKNYNNTYVKEFFDITANSEIFNDNLSLSYDNSYVYDNWGFSSRFVSEKSNLTVGFAAQHSELDGTILNTATEINQTQWQLLPRIRWNYSFSNSTRLSFRYSTSTQEPTLEQLQPTLDNSDPLNLYQGNPDLNQEYRHTGRIRLSSFNRFTFTNVFAMLSGSYTSDKITNAQTIDNRFVQTIRPINVDDDYSTSLYLYFGTPIRPIKSKINIRTNSSFTRSILFVNTTANDVDRFSNSINFSIENRNKEIVDIKVGTRISHNTTTYSVSTNLNQEYLSTGYYADLFIDFLKTWTFSTAIDYTVYSGDLFIDNPTIPILQASLSKRFLKGNTGLLKLSVYDIFNQNVGINRASEFNYIEDKRVSTLSRYILLSFTYKIRRFGGKKKKDSTN